MLEIRNRSMQEKIQQLKKGIEIVAGEEELKKIANDDSEFIEAIIETALSGQVVSFEFGNKTYTVDEVIKNKVEYEKYFLKNKLKTLNSILYKIKKYNTSLESSIRRYKKTRSLEEYNNIYETISKTYRRDINILVLKEFNIEIVEALTIEDEDIYYGEYLKQKKKQIIDGVISKLGIV